ncbi:MAG: hypothetical protein RML45_08060 [Acetobacteraceae bacterium]|nr:hypothetical protein [Acetobacteraceae bacterium]
MPLVPAACEVLVQALAEGYGVHASLATLPDRARLLGASPIFPNGSGSAPISDLAVSAVMRRMP